MSYRLSLPGLLLRIFYSKQNLSEAAGAGFVDHVIKELLDSPPELVPGSVVASSAQPSQSVINDTTSESPS
ncbi:MAG TPA: hypothetical protein DDW91_19235 [Shewanella frigidimarina]|nr:hypothetical protein [Shewanella frigidimarina]